MLTLANGLQRRRRRVLTLATQAYSLQTGAGMRH